MGPRGAPKRGSLDAAPNDVRKRKAGGQLDQTVRARAVFGAVLAFAMASTDGKRVDANAGGSADQLVHAWQLIDGRHWQIASPASEEPDVTDALEKTRGRCTEGMVEVEGRMMVEGAGYFDAVDALQRNVCVDWINRTFPERCARFDGEHWRAVSADIPRKAAHFCIDRFEHPNRRGAYPWVLVSWDEARGICASQSKRLCTEAEWTFACEGEEALPYPYGYERDGDACVVDRPWRQVHAEALQPRNTARAKAELDRLWQGEPQGRLLGASAHALSPVDPRPRPNVRLLPAGPALLQ